MHGPRLYHIILMQLSRANAHRARNGVVVDQRGKHRGHRGVRAALDGHASVLIVAGCARAAPRAAYRVAAYVKAHAADPARGAPERSQLRGLSVRTLVLAAP